MTVICSRPISITETFVRDPTLVGVLLMIHWVYLGQRITAGHGSSRYQVSAIFLYLESERTDRRFDLEFTVKRQSVGT